MSAELTWKCHHCHQPITDHTGYLWLNDTDLTRHEKSLARWEQDNPGPTITGSALLDLPNLALWIPTHDACDPLPETQGYTIAIHRIRTEKSLISWTAHLMEKRWLESTNWRDILNSCAGPLPH